MGEEQNIAAACANSADDTVRTRADGIERLAAGAAVAEQTPAGTFHLDIDRAPTFVRAVIPFHQIFVYLDPGVRHRKLRSAVNRAPTSRAWRSPSSLSGGDHWQRAVHFVALGVV